MSLRRRTGRAAWEIETLTTNGQSDAALLDLLDRVVASAGADGALRLFLRLAAGSPLIEPALRHGFARVSDETLYEAAVPPAKTAHDVAVRPREPSDDVALFQLFSSRTPQEVRWHVALAPSEWRAAQEPLPGRVREWVVPAEQDGALDALIRVGRADHGSALQLLTRGTSLASVVAFALAQAAPGRPVRALIPEFAPEDAHALEDAGLHPTERTTLLVRPIAQRARRLESVEAALEGGVRPAV